MDKALAQKLKKTSKHVRKIADIASKETDNKPEKFVSKWSTIFETVVEIMEIFNE